MGIRKVFVCEGCGRDTKNKNRLCHECDTFGRDHSDERRGRTLVHGNFTGCPWTEEEYQDLMERNEQD